MVSLETLLEIQNIARLSPRREACGIVTSTDMVIPIKNASPTPERCFVFSKREYFLALRTLRERNQTIQCIWHTHPGPSAEPSQADLDFVRISKRDSLIVSAKDYRWLEYAEN